MSSSLTRETARAELRAGIEDVRFWPDAERGCAAWWAARVRFLIAERDQLQDDLKLALVEAANWRHAAQHPETYTTTTQGMLQGDHSGT